MGCRLWLDDRRVPPWGYDLWAKTAGDAIRMLQNHDVEHISLDHDLAEEHYSESVESTGYFSPPRFIDRSRFKEPTGYAVIEWMIENHHWPLDINVHTLNPTGAENMLALLREHAPDHVAVSRIKPKGL